MLTYKNWTYLIYTTWRVYTLWQRQFLKKVNCNVESEIKSLYSITLKSNSPPWTLKGSFTHAWFSKIRFTQLYRYSKCWHISLENIKKSQSLVLSLVLAKMSLRFRKLSSTGLWIQVFQNSNFNFSLDSSNYWQHILSGVFREVLIGSPFISEKTSHSISAQREIGYILLRNYEAIILFTNNLMI